MKIIVTGFKPFLDDKINPSERLALELGSSFPEIEALILPVEFEKSFAILQDEVLEKKPGFILMIGQASGRKNICLEKVALNWVQSEHEDEAGIRPKTGRILPSTELALMTSFPVDSVFLELKKLNFPVEISFSAGTYVCNDLYFRTLNRFKNIKSIFVHVPLFPEQLKPQDSSSTALIHRDSGPQKSQDSRPTLVYEKQLEVMKKMISLLKPLSLI